MLPVGRLYAITLTHPILTASEPAMIPFMQSGGGVQPRQGAEAGAVLQRPCAHLSGESPGEAATLRVSSQLAVLRVGKVHTMGTLSYAI